MSLRQAVVPVVAVALALVLAGCHGLIYGDDAVHPSREAEGTPDDPLRRGGPMGLLPGPTPENAGETEATSEPESQAEPTSPAPPGGGAPGPGPGPGPGPAPSPPSEPDPEPEPEPDPEPPGGNHTAAETGNVTLAANETLVLPLDVGAGFDLVHAAAAIQNTGSGNATGTLRLLGPDGTQLASQAFVLPSNATDSLEVEQAFPAGAPVGTYEAVLEVATGTVWVDLLAITAEG